MDFIGNNAKLLFRSQNVIYENKFDVFGDFIIFDTFISLHYINIFEMKDNIIAKFLSMTSMKIWHSSRQPNTTNRCLNSNCPHLCLPNGTESYRCVCSFKKECTETVDIIK